jgi:hypothetical protein
MNLSHIIGINPYLIFLSSKNTVLLSSVNFLSFIIYLVVFGVYSKNIVS